MRGRHSGRGARVLRRWGVLAVVLASISAVGGLATAAFALRHPPAARALSVSVGSGPPGTVVELSGNAGTGCAIGRTWSGLAFTTLGAGVGAPFTALPVPVAGNGVWTAQFVVPNFLGGSAKGSRGAPVAPGRYEFVARSCDGRSRATARFRVTAAEAVTAGTYVDMVATPDGHGYWLATSTGRVSAFGDARWYGSLPAPGTRRTAPIVGMATTPDGRGYWLAGADGRVYNFGDAASYRGAGTPALTAPVTGIAAAADGKGYWLAGEDGRVYSFGAAPSDGDADESLAPYEAIVARPAGGYILAAGNTVATFAFPGGGLLGGGGPLVPLSTTLTDSAATPSGNGAWQVGVTGGVFTSGDAAFFGSLPGYHMVPDAPVTAIAATPDGQGYWLLGSDGTVFSFGDAHFYGMVFQADG